MKGFASCGVIEGIPGSLNLFAGREIFQGLWTHIIATKALSREKTEIEKGDKHMQHTDKEVGSNTGGIRKM